MALKGRNVEQELVEAAPELAEIKAGSVEVHVGSRGSRSRRWSFDC